METAGLIRRHAGDFLGERIVWTDWQVTGVGCPASELAFLWSRATADGADVPYDAMVREYVAHRPIEPALLRRALLAAEIDILLFDWPGYVTLLSHQARDRLTRRLLHLIDDWHTHIRGDQPLRRSSAGLNLGPSLSR